MRTYGEQLFDFYRTMEIPRDLPEEVYVLYPFNEPQVVDLLQRFFHAFYNDRNPRRLMLGINPGRFGAGNTGINFTGSRQLKNNCGIDHDLKEQTELSAEFIHDMIEQYGGPKKFYGDYFIGAVSPLGFVKNKVNMNYYDDKKLAAALTPFIVSGIRKLLAIGFDTRTCFCIGEGKNFIFLTRLNAEHCFFKEIIPLPHPRFIMQYRRKQKDKFIQQYLDELRESR